MNRIFALIVSGGCVLWAPALLAQSENDSMAINHEFPAQTGPTSANDPGAIAEDLRVKGHCDRAMRILRRLVADGGGDRIAQYNLGLCLIDLARNEADPAAAGAMRKEGASWILRAANGGLGKAQAEAVTVCMEGIGMAPDPVQAEKWALIYKDNPTRLALGLPGIDQSRQDRLDGMLTAAQRTQAESQADDFQPAGGGTDR